MILYTSKLAMGIKHQIEMANSIVFYRILPSLEHDHYYLAY